MCRHLSIAAAKAAAAAAAAALLVAVLIPSWVAKFKILALAQVFLAY